MMSSPNSDRPEGEFDDLSVVSALSSSAKVGAATGAAGLLLGSVAGILRSSNPVVFTVASGIQCFGLGSIFSLTRQTILAGPPSASPSAHTTRQTAVASALSGVLAGGSMGALRSRANALPGAIFWGLAGLAGQVGWDWRQGRLGDDSHDGLRGGADTSMPSAGATAATATSGAGAGGNLTARLVAARSGREAEGPAPSASEEGKEPFWVRWTPMKALSDTDYEAMLTERLVKLNAEIAIADEDLEKLRAEQKMLREKGSGSGSGDDRTER